MAVQQFPPWYHEFDTNSFFGKSIDSLNIGKVTNGMQTVDSIYTGYSGKTMDTLKTLYHTRSKFLELFPKLDSIKKAYIGTLKKNQ